MDNQSAEDGEINKCMTCRKKDQKFEMQCMGPLLEERLKPAPAWNATIIDFFGPIEIRGQVNKRSRGKVYGVLFNCLVSRAVFVDLSVDYINYEKFRCYLFSLKGGNRKLITPNFFATEIFSHRNF